MGSTKDRWARSRRLRAGGIALWMLAIAGPAWPNADLDLEKLDAADPVGVGATLHYALTVTNHGPDVAEDVVVVDTLPPGVTFLSSLACQETATGFRCEVGDMPPGAYAVFAVQVIAPDRDGVITNTARVTARTPDPVPSNDSASEATTVLGSLAPSTIVIRAVSTPADARGFVFQGDLGSFVLDAGDSAVFPVQPGRYRVREALARDGWTLEGIRCESIGPSTAITSAADGWVDLDIEDDDTVSCTFSNRFDPEEGFGCIDR